MITSGRHFLAFLLTFILVFGPSSLLLASPEIAQGTLKGRLFAADLVHPAPEVIVQAVQEGSKTPLATTKTDAQGRFSFSRVPVGDVLLVLSQKEGTPLAAAVVSAQAGKTRTITLALPDPKNAGAGPLTPAVAHGKGFAAFFSTPLGATVAILAGAIIVGGVAESSTDSADEPPSSPSKLK